MDEAEAAPQKATPYPAQEQSTPVAFGKQPAAQDGADANGMEPEPSVATEQPATAAAAAAIKKAVKKRSLQDIQSSAAGEDPGERNGEQQAKKTAFTANRVSQGGLTPRGGKKPTTPKEFIEKIRGYIHEKFDVDYDFSEWTCEVSWRKGVPESGPLCDPYWYAPCGTKLRSQLEIARFLGYMPKDPKVKTPRVQKESQPKPDVKPAKIAKRRSSTMGEAPAKTQCASTKRKQDPSAPTAPTEPKPKRSKAPTRELAAPKSAPKAPLRDATSQAKAPKCAPKAKKATAPKRKPGSNRHASHNQVSGRVAAALQPPHACDQVGEQVEGAQTVPNMKDRYDNAVAESLKNGVMPDTGAIMRRLGVQYNPMCTRAGPHRERWEQAQLAKEAASLHTLAFPLDVGYGVTIHRLGTPIAIPGFHTRRYIYPPETLVSWRNEEKTFTIFFSIECIPMPQPDAPTTANASADPTVAPPEMAPQEPVATVDRPCFTITALRGNIEPPTTGTVYDAMNSFGSEAVELACSFESPQDVCREFFAMHELALGLVRPPIDASTQVVVQAADAVVAAHAAGVALEGIGEIRLLALMQNEPLLTMLQQLPTEMMRWPRLLFGLSSIPVLTCLEGHEAVEHCTRYKYVQDRGGWCVEAKLISYEQRISAASLRKRKVWNRQQEDAAANCYSDDPPAGVPEEVSNGKNLRKGGAKKKRSGRKKKAVARGWEAVHAQQEDGAVHAQEGDEAVHAHQGHEVVHAQQEDVAVCAQQEDSFMHAHQEDDAMHEQQGDEVMHEQREDDTVHAHSVQALSMPAEEQQAMVLQNNTSEPVSEGVPTTEAMVGREALSQETDVAIQNVDVHMEDQDLPEWS